MKICGYGLISGLCQDEPDGDWCIAHNSPRYSVCSNCGRPANHVCPTVMGQGARCLAALCTECVHGQDDSHQHIDEIPDVLAGSPRHPQVQQQRQNVTDQLAAVVGASLARLQSQGALTLQEHADPDEIGAQIVRDLGAHALAGLLAGLARTR
jgi:hypothetical protein